MSQGERNFIEVFEDFKAGSDDDILAVVDADGLRFNDIFITAQSGQLDIIGLAESNGVWRFNGAGGASDGFTIHSGGARPDRCGTLRAQIRMRASAVTAWRWFFGFVETIDRDENVCPFTLSGTTLTANNAGQCVGVYFDTAATTDDVRFQASSDGVAQTTALSRGGTALGALGTRMNTTLIAAKYICIEIEMDADGAVRLYYGDDTIDPQGTGPKEMATLRAGVLDTTAVYHPVFHCVDVSTGDANYDMDYFGFRYRRDWTS